MFNKIKIILVGLGENDREIGTKIRSLLEQNFDEINISIYMSSNLENALLMNFRERFSVAIVGRKIDKTKTGLLKKNSNDIILIYLEDNISTYKKAEPYRVVDTLGEAIEKTVEACKRIKRKEKTEFVYRKNNIVLSTELNSIIYFWSDKRKIYFKTIKNDEDSFYEKMDVIELRLIDYPNFVRINTSFIVNRNYIRDIKNKSSIVTIDGTVFNIRNRKIMGKLL